MKFKGRDFVQVRNVVSLPASDKDGNLMSYAEKPSNYVIFGKVSKLGEKKAGAVKSDFHRKLEGGGKVDIFAVPIKTSGYSLTNMAYGADGYIYLMFDGRFYRSTNKIASHNKV